MKSTKKNRYARALISILCPLMALLTPQVFAQGGGLIGKSPIYEMNTITTAVPLLMIAPDARAGALGDAGVASVPDANSIHWNPAKLAFINDDLGFSVSYTPWLRALVPDINLAYLSAYSKVAKDQVLAATLLYFSLGNIVFTNEQGETFGEFSPNEFAFDLAYSRKLSDNFSGGMALRYIYSNLTGHIYVGGTQSKPGKSVATDVSAYYQKHIVIKDKPSLLAFGLNISNIGSKISYTETAVKSFIPINMRLGGSLKIDLDEYNTISLLTDLNKLLVPTPPVFDTIDGVQLIKFGKDPNRSIVDGMIGSFSDAPGAYWDPQKAKYIEEPGRFKEEFREINYSVGIEYWYDKQFAIRAGYFYEHPTKGNRKFFTLGAGLKYNVFGLDFAYLIPTEQRHPLENTLRFTLLFDFEALKAQNKEQKTAE